MATLTELYHSVCRLGLISGISTGQFVYGRMHARSGGRMHARRDRAPFILQKKKMPVLKDRVSGTEEVEMEAK